MNFFHRQNDYNEVGDEVGDDDGIVGEPVEEKRNNFSELTDFFGKLLQLHSNISLLENLRFIKYFPA